MELKLLLTGVVGPESDTDRVIYRPTTGNDVPTWRVDIVGRRSRCRLNNIKDMSTT